MIKKRFPKEGWEAIAPAFVCDEKQYFYLRVNPIGVEDSIIATETLLDHEPTEQDVEEFYAEVLRNTIRLKTLAIEEYAKTSAVKTYNINGVAGWEDSDARTSISKAATDKENAGRTEYTLYHGGVGFVVTPARVREILSAVEVYASDCYDTTEHHKAAIKDMTDIQEVEDYDFTLDYPEVPNFEVA